MNNSIGKSVELNLSFLPAGNYEAETWSDTKNSDKEPKELKKAIMSVKSPGTFKGTHGKKWWICCSIKKKIAKTINHGLHGGHGNPRS